MADDMNSMSRREVLKTTAKVAGVAAFAAPVIVGSFSTPALAQSVTCRITDSDAVPAILGASISKNQNCGDGCCGRYNGQKINYTLAGVTGTGVLAIGNEAETDNFLVDESWYTIKSIAGYECVATWSLSKCPKFPSRGAPALSTTSGTANGGLTKLPLPYCKGNINPETGLQYDCDEASAGNKLQLEGIVCCPTGTTPQ